MHCRFQSLTPCFADFQKAGITNLLNHPTSVSAISIPGSGIVWCSTTFFFFFLVIGLAEKLCSANRQEIYVHLWATELDANSQASHDRIPPPSASAPTGASSSGSSRSPLAWLARARWPRSRMFAPSGSPRSIALVTFCYGRRSIHCSPSHSVKCSSRTFNEWVSGLLMTVCHMLRKYRPAAKRWRCSITKPDSLSTNSGSSYVWQVDRY